MVLSFLSDEGAYELHDEKFEDQFSFDLKASLQTKNRDKLFEVNYNKSLPSCAFCLEKSNIFSYRFNVAKKFSLLGLPEAKLIDP